MMGTTILGLGPVGPLAQRFTVETIFWLLAGAFIAGNILKRYSPMGESFLRGIWVSLVTGHVEMAFGEVLCSWLTIELCDRGGLSKQTELAIHVGRQLLYLLWLVRGMV